MAPKRKFTPEQEQKIRDEHIAGKPQSLLAAEHGTTQSLISKIIAEGKATIPPEMAPGPDLLMLHDSVIISGANPRRTFSAEEIVDLANSIEINGLMQNLVVARNENAYFKIVAGERRFRAIKLLLSLGKWHDRIPCRVVEGDEQTLVALALVENIQRVDMPPLEEADAYVKLIEHDPEAWTTATIASRIGRSQRYVQQRIALATKLAPAAREALQDRRISIEGARHLTAHPESVQTEVLEDFAEQERLEISADELSEYLPRPPGSVVAPLAHALDGGDVGSDDNVIKDEDLTYVDRGFARPYQAPAPVSEPEPKSGALWTKSHIYHAHKRKTAVLQSSISSNPNLAARIACLALLGPADPIGIHPGSAMAAVSEDKLKHLPEIEARIDRILGKTKRPRFYGDHEDQLALWHRLGELTGFELDELFAATVARRVFDPAGYDCHPGDNPLSLAIAETLKIPGHENKYGLTLTRDDLAGLRKSFLLRIADDSDTPAVNDATPIGELIDAIVTTAKDRNYVLPTLRFGTTKQIEAASAP